MTLRPIRWRARLRPTIGNAAVAQITGQTIEFDVPETFAEATASIVRRVIQRTNPAEA